MPQIDNNTITIGCWQLERWYVSAPHKPKFVVTHIGCLHDTRTSGYSQWLTGFGIKSCTCGEKISKEAKLWIFMMGG